MKFAWKVTLAALCILMLSTSVGSYLLISLSFQSALEREIDVAREEMQMLRITYEAVCSARGITLENLDGKSASLRRTLGEDPYFADRQFRVSTQEGIQVHSTLSSSGYILRFDQRTGRHLVHCAGAISLPDGALYMETVRDISSLFSDREIHYQVYRWVALLVVGVSAALIFAFAYWLTTPIRALGRVATQLAQGDYTPRAQVSGDDEIGELAASFNRMAGAIAKNVQELEDAARRQEDFTGSFVHELKTPLTSIIGYADMLRSRTLDEDRRFKAASYIFSEGKRLENLSLALMSLLVVGHTRAEVKSVNMGLLCQQAGRSALPAMTAQNLHLVVQAEEASLPGDPSLLQTLLQNLLDNARKASEPDTVVALDGQRTEAGYRITVTDQGRGIPEEELDKITEAFYMVDKSRSRAQGGAGLGLALCKEIAALHRGELRFESQVGLGTKVTVELEGIHVE